MKKESGVHSRDVGIDDVFIVGTGAIVGHPGFIQYTVFGAKEAQMGETNVLKRTDYHTLKYVVASEGDGFALWALNNIGQGLPVVGPVLGRSAQPVELYRQGGVSLLRGLGMELDEADGVQTPIGMDLWDYWAKLAGLKPVAVRTPWYARQQKAVDMKYKIPKPKEDK